MQFVEFNHITCLTTFTGDSCGLCSCRLYTCRTLVTGAERMSGGISEFPQGFSDTCRFSGMTVCCQEWPAKFSHQGIAIGMPLASGVIHAVCTFHRSLYFYHTVLILKCLHFFAESPDVW